MPCLPTKAWIFVAVLKWEKIDHKIIAPLILREGICRQFLPAAKPTGHRTVRVVVVVVVVVGGGLL